MYEKFTDSDSLALLRRLVTELGTPQLLRLLASVADQHAKELAQEGPTQDAARFAREAKILSRASEAIAD
jgi:hypothetical protein